MRNFVILNEFQASIGNVSISPFFHIYQYDTRIEIPVCWFISQRIDIRQEMTEYILNSCYCIIFQINLHQFLDRTPENDVAIYIKDSVNILFNK